MGSDVANLRWLGQPASCDTLPSAGSAAALVRGDVAAVPLVLWHTLVRATLIGIGLAVVGQREHLVRNAIAGAAAIEVFVLGYQYVRQRS